MKKNEIEEVINHAVIELAERIKRSPMLKGNKVLMITLCAMKFSTSRLSKIKKNRDKGSSSAPARFTFHSSRLIRRTHIFFVKRNEQYIIYLRNLGGISEKVPNK